MLQKGMIEIGNDIGKRFLAEREKMRIGGVTMYAADKIQKNLALGIKLREDGFSNSQNQEILHALNYQS